MKILLVEDDDKLAQLIILKLCDCDFERAQNLTAALEALECRRFDCSVVDLNIPVSALPDAPVSQGLKTFHAVKGHGLKPPIVVYSGAFGMYDPEVDEIIREGAAFVPKGLGNFNLLQDSIKQTVERHVRDTTLRRKLDDVRDSVRAL